MQYIGNVHGDEPVGRELLLRLANWICDNYEIDPLVIDLSASLFWICEKKCSRPTLILSIFWYAG